MKDAGASEPRARKRLNFRPVLFCALGFAFGVFLYGECRFGGLRPSDFLFLALFLFFAFFPFGLKRVLAVLLSVLLFAGAGALLLHLHTERFVSEAPGRVVVHGTVESLSVKRGYSVAVLGGLRFDGEKQGGKCLVIFSGEEVRLADELRFEAAPEPVLPDGLGGDPYLMNSFARDIRYTANVPEYEKTGESGNPFLRLNAALWEVLKTDMGGDEADVAYALLTGNSGNMDAGIGELARRGGIAHIFAVSGLHIGILFSAVYLVCRRLGRWRVVPALLLAVCYCALCNFTVSSVRAVIMCGSAGLYGVLGRKRDFLEAISFAALAVLLFAPAQWFSAGFRLSFGACVGLALFSGSFSRGFSRFLPKRLSDYLGASLSVQLMTIPVLTEAFGYVSVWGLLLNLVLIPVLPVLFLGLLVFALLALIIPPAGGFFLLFPKGLLSLLLYVLSVADVSFVLAGFSLGVGGTVWLIGCVALSERLRLSRRERAAAASALAVLFTAAVVLENVVFAGCTVEVPDGSEGNAAFVRSPQACVLVIGGEISLGRCEELLLRQSYSSLTVVVLTEDEVAGANTAAFLGADEIRLKDEVETGLSVTPILFGDTFSVGGLSFRYESREKLTLLAEGLVVEFDFGGNPALGADLFVDGVKTGLKYFLNSGIIYAG